LACAVLGAANPKQFFFSWLVSFLFFLSLTVGALFFVLIQYATQGGWGIVVRRIGETTFATIPVMAALFAWALFGEAIGPVQFTGAAIVLAGIWISRKGS
jgi:drug/metabolite transporter (DMT)-like permease